MKFFDQKIFKDVQCYPLDYVPARHFSTTRVFDAWFLYQTEKI